jgi:hypothetical protein
MLKSFYLLFISVFALDPDLHLECNTVTGTNQEEIKSAANEGKTKPIDRQSIIKKDLTTLVLNV